jgi:glycosyltransferase involved in cell wall biosynthesis
MIASSRSDRQPPSVLFVGSNAYRAGAQIELLHVLRWLSQRRACVPSVLLAEDGELLSDYESVAPTHVLRRRGQRSVVARARRSMERRLGLEPERSFRRLQGQPFDLIYASSAAIFNLVPALAKACRAPVVCHVHELEASILKYCGVDAFEKAMAASVGVVAASGAVEQTLAKRYRVPADKLARVYEGVVTEDFPRLNVEERAAARARLRLPTDAFIVGGCGTMDWRKAPDVFLQVARKVRNDQRPFHFVWVGGRLNGLEHFTLSYDALRFGVSDQVHFVGPQPNPREFFAAFDAFLLTSREDPFPLVCLEAAALGLPILCFEESGGMPEFVEQDAGRVIPYLDVELVAACLRELCADPELGARWGRRAADKVRERFDISNIAPQVAAVIERHARKQGTA